MCELYFISVYFIILYNYTLRVWLLLTACCLNLSTIIFFKKLCFCFQAEGCFLNGNGLRWSCNTRHQGVKLVQMTNCFKYPILISFIFNIILQQNAMGSKNHKKNIHKCNEWFLFIGFTSAHISRTVWNSSKITSHLMINASSQPINIFEKLNISRKCIK